MKSFLKKIGIFVDSANRRVCFSVAWVVGLLAVPMAIVFYVFISETNFDNYYRFYRTTIHAVTDAACFLAPFIFLGPRRLWALWFPVVILPLFCWVESVYFRCFHDVIPLSSFTLVSTVDDLVLSSAIAAFRLSDLIFLLPAAVLTVILIVRRCGLIVFTPNSTRVKFIGVDVAVLMLLFNTAWFIRAVSYDPDKKNYFECFIHGEHLAYRWRHEVSLRWYLRDFGVRGLVFKYVEELFTPALELTDADRADINDFFSKRHNSFVNPYKEIFEENEGKNLILVIVESLNSFVFDVPEEINVVPTLRRLAADSSAIVALKVIPDVGPGRSSDGQLLYNTGLIPLSDEPFVSRYATANYPSLAKALKGFESFEVISDEISLWHHNETTNSYGFDRIYDRVGISVADIDSANLHTSLDIIKRQKQPFYAQITTINMHEPFRELSVPDRLDHKAMDRFTDDAYLQTYLQRVKSFDLALERFLEGLKAAGIYENSVIVIVSDHHLQTTFDDSRGNNSDIAMIILNSGIGMKIDRHIRQRRVFPTILSIMNIDDYVPAGLSVPYHGFGPSIFETETAYNPDRANQISRQIIKGRYFGN